MSALFPDRRAPLHYPRPVRKGIHRLLAGLLAMFVFMASSCVIHLVWRLRAIRMLDYPLVAWVEWAGFILVLLLPAILFISAAEKGRSGHGRTIFLAWACLVAIWVVAWNWRLYFIIDFLYPHWPGEQQYLTGALLMAFLAGAGLWLIIGLLWVSFDPHAAQGRTPDDWSEGPYDLWKASRSRDGDIDLDF